MINCPICRALLNGDETCRRCRAELKQAQEVERQGHDLAGAAMHLLAVGNTAGAVSLLRRACVVHATPEARLLSMIVAHAYWGTYMRNEGQNGIRDDDGADDAALA